MRLAKHIQFILVIAAMLYACADTAVAMRIALVDLERVFVEYRFTQESDELLRQEKERKQQALSEFEDKVKNMKDSYEARRASLSSDERRQKEEELQMELDNLQRIYHRYTTELRTMNDEMLDKIREHIQDAVEHVGRESGFDIVLQKEAVLFGGVDITDRVIAYLNDNYKSGQ